MLASPLLRIINNWLHDVGTGLWAASLLALAVIDRRSGSVAGVASAAAVLRDVEWLMFWLLLGALAVIAATGVARLLYWRRETPAEELPAKRPALIWKHVGFLVIYGGGTVWALSLLGVL